MSVRKPPEGKSTVNVEELIDRGAPVKGEKKVEEEKAWRMINLRIQQEMLDKVDKSVNNRVGITRTGWILEAIYEKLKS